MSYIRLLIIQNYDDQLILPKRLELSSALKVVCWQQFSLETLPLSLDKIVDIEMQYSKVKQFWNATQSMEKLKHIDLRYSLNLIETPDFLSVPNLEHLCLIGCKSLVKVHTSLGKLKRLVKVDFSECIILEILPRKLETNSLESLVLRGCGNIVVLPKFGEDMKKLSYLDVSGTAIITFPESLGSLTGLEYLNLSGYKLLKTPMNCQIFGLNLRLLIELYLHSCGLNDGSIPNNISGLSSLIVLDLRANDFVNLPTGCFSSLFRLLYLFLDYCVRLKSLPRLPAQLIWLSAVDCDSMEPLSDRQLWYLVTSHDHEGHAPIKGIINVNNSLVLVQPECLPQRDFVAIMPARCQIPSWCTNKEYYPFAKKRKECEIKVDIPQYKSEWFGIVVCLHVLGWAGVIWWSSKAAEDDDYICKEWAHAIYRGHNVASPQLCIMVLELNEKTCWQHLTPHNNSLHILLSTNYSTIGGEMKILGCGWRVICKEEMQECCHLNHLTQPPLHPTPHQVMLSWTVLDQVAKLVYSKDRKRQCIR